MTQTLPQPPADDRIDLRALAHLLRRQMRLIVLGAGLVLLLAILFLVTTTPLYTARVLIMVDPTQQNLLNADEAGLRPAMMDNARIDSEVEILRSPATALAVIDAANLMQDPEFGPQLGLMDRLRIAAGAQVAPQATGDGVVQSVRLRLQRASAIRRIGQTHLIAIDITSQDPQKAADLANLMAQSSITAQVAAKIDASQAARAILSRQLEAGRALLAETDATLNDFIDQTLDDMARQSSDPALAAAQSTLAELRARQEARRATEETAQAALSTRDYLTLAETLADAGLRALAQQEADLRGQIAQSPPDAARLSDLQGALAEIDAELNARAQDQIATISTDLAEITRQGDEIRSELRADLLRADLPSATLAQLFDLQQAATLTRGQYQALLAQLTEVETRAALQVADSRIVSPALAPIAPSAPNTRLVLAVALVAGVMLGLAIAVINDIYIGGVTNGEQLRMVTGQAEAAIIPRLEGRAGAVVDAVIDAPLSPYAESLRKLRAALELQFRAAPRDAPAPKGGRVVMVASSLPAEGKTSLAIGLARIYAVSGRSTLLIDADLRKPAVAGYLGIPTSHGLLHILTHRPQGDDDESLAIGRDAQSPLRLLLGAGRAQIATDELVSAQGFADLLAHARAHFDMVIIDTSPVLPVVDARYIADQVDAIVLVTRWAQTRLSDLRSAFAALAQASAHAVPILPVLSIHGAKGAAEGYGYGYGADGPEGRALTKSAQ